LKAMEKKSEDRYATAGLVSDALKKVLVRLDAAADGLPAPAVTQAPAPPPPPPRKSSAAPVLVSLVLLMLLGGGAGAAVWWFKFRKAPAPVLETADLKPAKKDPVAVTPDAKPE